MAAFLAHSGYDLHAIAFMREGSVCRSSVWPKPARRAGNPGLRTPDLFA